MYIIINALLETAMCIGLEVKLVSETHCADGRKQKPISVLVAKVESRIIYKKNLESRMICQLFDAMCSHSVHIFEPFHVCLASKFAESVNTTLKIFFPYIFNMGIKKTQNLISISTPLKK